MALMNLPLGGNSFRTGTNLFGGLASGAQVSPEIMAEAERLTTQQMQQQFGGRGATVGTRQQMLQNNIRLLERQYAKNPPAAPPQHLTEDPFSLSKRTNEFMTEQALAPYLANLPGFAGMQQQRSATLAQQMAGEVPTDVVNQILQQAAERGISTGMPGSGNSNSAFLRALGLTSMGLQQQGMAGFSQAMADTPVPELLNPASITVPERFASQEEQAYQRSRTPVKTGNVTHTPAGWSPQITPWKP
jgi:hypothetical protein